MKTFRFLRVAGALSLGALAGCGNSAPDGPTGEPGELRVRCSG